MMGIKTIISNNSKSYNNSKQESNSKPQENHCTIDSYPKRVNVITSTAANAYRLADPVIEMSAKIYSKLYPTNLWIATVDSWGPVSCRLTGRRYVV